MEVIIRTVAEAHGLTATEIHELRRIVVGTLPGNRNRPLFLLAASILRSGTEDLLPLVLPGNTVLTRSQTALLDVLLSAALEDEVHATRFVTALATAQMASDPIRALTSDFAALLHACRRRAFPEARHHNVFTAVRRFLLRHRPHDPLPRDGDGPPFWEAEATRDLLTRYSTALRALADYAEAARLAASWRDAKSLDDETTLAVSSDETSFAGWDDPLSGPRLEAALAEICGVPVKLLLAHERDTLAALAGLADIVRIWPGDVLAALSLGHVQNAVIQSLRRGETLYSSEPFLATAQSFAEIHGRHAGLGDALMAVLYLIAQTRDPLLETRPVRSIPASAVGKRIAAMERRQGFAEFPDAERAAALTPLIEPVLALRAMMETYLKCWNKLGPTRGAELDRAHRMLFRRKLDALYCDAPKVLGT